MAPGDLDDLLAPGDLDDLLANGDLLAGDVDIRLFLGDLDRLPAGVLGREREDFLTGCREYDLCPGDLDPLRLGDLRNCVLTGERDDDLRRLGEERGVLFLRGDLEPRLKGEREPLRTGDLDLRLGERDLLFFLLAGLSGGESLGPSQWKLGGEPERGPLKR